MNCNKPIAAIKLKISPAKSKSITNLQKPNSDIKYPNTQATPIIFLNVKSNPLNEQSKSIPLQPKCKVSKAFISI